MNVLSALYLGYLCLTIGAISLGQAVYLCVLIALYIVSALFHGLPWTPLRWTCDQSCIGVVIIAKPMPFLYTEWWSWIWFFGASFLFVCYKHFKWERTPHMGAVVFLFLGVISFSLIAFVAFPDLRLHGHEPSTGLLLAITVLFVVLQAQYFFDWPAPIGDMWGSAETFHVCLFGNFLLFIYSFVIPYGGWL